MILSIAFALTACGTATQEAGKPLAVHRMGFILPEGAYPVPGETVEVFAQANKEGGVAYQWSGPGLVEPAKAGRALWTIPTDPGEHILSVTAIDEGSGLSCAKGLKIMVNGSSAAAIPESFRMKIEQSSTIKGKAVGDIASASTMEISYSGNSYRVKVDNEGNLSDILCVKGQLYGVDEDGRGMPIGVYNKGLDIEAMARPPVYSIDNLSEGTTRVDLGGGLIGLSRNNEGMVSSLVYDTVHGQLLSQRTEDGESGFSSLSEYSYQVVDGYVFIDKVSISTTMRLADEDYATTQNVEISDIQVESIAAEEITEGVAL